MFFYHNKFFTFKRPKQPPLFFFKFRNQKFMLKCTCTYCVIKSLKVPQNSVLSFERSCCYKRQDWSACHILYIPQLVALDNKFVILVRFSRPSGTRACRLHVISTHTSLLYSVCWFNWHHFFLFITYVQNNRIIECFERRDKYIKRYIKN